MWVSFRSTTDFLNKPSTNYVKTFKTPSLKNPSVALHCLPNKAQQSIWLVSASPAQAHPTSSTRDMSCSSASDLDKCLSFHMPFLLMPGGVTWIFQDVSLLLFSLWLFGPTALRSVSFIILIKLCCHILRNLQELSFFFSFPSSPFQEFPEGQLHGCVTYAVTQGHTEKASMLGLMLCH